MITFDEFLDKLTFSDLIQSYYDPGIFFRIFFIDTIDERILLSVGNEEKIWFTKNDFIFGVNPLLKIVLF